MRGGADTPDALFDVTRTTDSLCLICRAVRAAGDERAEKCEIDELRRAGEYRIRPAACLNTIDPAHTQIPY